LPVARWRRQDSRPKGAWKRLAPLEREAWAFEFRSIFVGGAGGGIRDDGRRMATSAGLIASGGRSSRRRGPRSPRSADPAWNYRGAMAEGRSGRESVGRRINAAFFPGHDERPDEDDQSPLLSQIPIPYIRPHRPQFPGQKSEGVSYHRKAEVGHRVSFRGRFGAIRRG